MNHKKFVKERDESLLSLDKEKIVEFLRKNNVQIPENETVFWAGVHKAITAIDSATLEQKIDSMMWLVEHGFKPGV